jgi:PAS domain S-box-containing protein
MKERPRQEPAAILRLVGRKARHATQSTSSRAHSTTSDYSSLIRISTAEIACFEFPSPIACAQPAADFVNELYATHSKCLDASLVFALARGRQTVDEVLGLPLSELMPPSDGFANMFHSWHLQSLTGRCFECTFHPATKPSAVVQCVVYGKIEDEKLSRVWIVGRDVTSHSRAVDALARSELHYRSLVERPGMVFARISADGCYEYVTPSLAETIGVKLEEVSSRRVKVCDYVHPDDLPVVDTLLSLRQRPPRTEAYDTELRLRTPHGLYRWFSLRQLPVLSSNGALQFIDILATDITEAKLIEQEVQSLRPQALAGQMAAGVAHDIRNHLTAALGNLELALENSSTLSPQLHETLAACKLSLSSGLELSRDFTTLSRSESTHSQCSTDLAAAVTDMEDLFQSQIPLSAELIIERVPSVTVPLSRTRLQNVLLNLLINARDALPVQGGWITIGATLNNAETEAPSVTIFLTDNGSGISPELLPSIFEPYVSTKLNSGGSGLGLHSVRSCITAVGGTISVSSTIGKGTEFQISLPICPPHCKMVCERPSATAPAPEIPPLSILIADDEPAIRSMLEIALMRRGHTVDSVADGAELLDRFRDMAQSYDLILLDESMPRSPGRDMLHQVRSLAKKTPMIVTSGDHSVAEELHALGDKTQFLAKPFTLADLENAIAAAANIAAD